MQRRDGRTSKLAMEMEDRCQEMRRKMHAYKVAYVQATEMAAGEERRNDPIRSKERKVDSRVDARRWRVRRDRGDRMTG